MHAMSLLPLAFQRETAIIAALAALIVAGAVVALGAFVMFRRERRATRQD
jgi:hypothetical protein